MAVEIEVLSFKFNWTGQGKEKVDALAAALKS